MKKIFIYLCFFSLFGCAGYEPLFSSKNLSFYVKSVENIDNNKIVKKISRNLGSNKLKISGKKSYTLKITSNESNNITSKDTRGNPLTYNMVLNIEVKAFNGSSGLLINTFKLNKNFNYNNQLNKFNLSMYKKNILENMIDKISKDIVIKLQSL
jgi:outer membrane lipopolysaccharide assembly protein LptE/RlpB|tara:strand:- start:37 stop:498 length:462 start_codon:yes stop_codon:yes gene_type:complete